MKAAMQNFMNGLGLIILVCVLYIVYQYASLIGMLVLVGFGLMVLTGTGLGFWFAIERILMVRANRVEAQKNSQIVTVHHNGFVGIRDTSPFSSSWQVYNTPRLTGSANQIPPLPESTTPIDLLAALDSVQRGLIVGASDSGKTTLLQQIVMRRLAISEIIIIDPHAWPGKWPTGQVVGLGRNYPEIDKYLNALVRLMTKRYDDIGKGLVPEMGHKKITIIIDEWRAITNQLGASASEAIKALLTESRKAAFSVFVASHSDRAKPLGLEGEYDLKDGFAVVRLSNINGRRQATLDTGNGETPVLLPGPFTMSQSKTMIEGSYTSLDIEDEESRDELFVRLVGEGMSRSEASMKAYGKSYAGTSHVQHCRRLLGEI